MDYSCAANCENNDDSTDGQNGGGGTEGGGDNTGETNITEIQDNSYSWNVADSECTKSFNTVVTTFDSNGD